MTVAEILTGPAPTGCDELGADRFLVRLRCAGPDVDDLAAVWPDVTPDRLALAVTESVGIDLDDDERLEMHLTIGTWLATNGVRMVDPGVVDAYVDLVDVAGAYADLVDVADQPTGGLHVDHALSGLPLLDLAADVARLEPTGRLAVRSLHERPGPGVDGAFFRGRHGAVIALWAVLGPPRLAEVWAHELAHALDPDIVDRHAAEAFADHLGRLLLELAPPSVEAAAMAIARTLATVRPQPRTVPTARTVEALIGWALEQVLTVEGD